MLRSPLSGVASEIAGAYAALCAHEGPLESLLSGGRLAVPAAHRESVLEFARALRDLATFPSETSETERKDAIRRRFRLESSGRSDRNVDERSQFDLADAAPAELPSGVAARNPRFSASQLNTFSECRRKWFYRYVCAAVEDKGSSASYYGTAFHAALESFHAEYPEPGNVPRAELERKLLAYLNTAFERQSGNFDTPVERELQVRRARRTARKYVEWLVAEAARAPFTVVGCEIPAQLELGGFEFIGYIDRLDRDRDTGSVAVIDYKTGSIATTAAEYREKVRAFKDFQLPFYYWARTAAGERVSRLALVPLKDALLDVRPIALEVVPISADAIGSNGANGIISIAELERARSRMIELCRELCSGSITGFAVTDDPSSCTYCAYAGACVDRPYPVENRFAR